MLAAGADVNAQTDDGWTPLYRALFANRLIKPQVLPATHEAAIQLLLAAGSDINLRTADGETPLARAVVNKNLNVINMLLLAPGADVDVRNNAGETPLHTAVRTAAYWGGEVVKALLAAGANPNSRDANGNTPLHWVAEDIGNPALVKALLDAGADRLARNAAGETPWDLLQRNERRRGTEGYRRLRDALFNRP